MDIPSHIHITHTHRICTCALDTAAAFYSRSSTTAQPQFSHLTLVHTCRLACLNAADRDFVRKHAPKTWDIKHGGTAQKLNWTSFRNERFRGGFVVNGVDDDFFAKGLKDKIPGVLEFDYAPCVRMPQGVAPMADKELQQLLVELGLKQVL